MKRTLILMMFILAGHITGMAQEKIFIHKTDGMTLGAPVLATDSIWFSSDGSISWFRIKGSVSQYPVNTIDSISFGNNVSTIYITYNGTTAEVVNPLAFEGVSVQVTGADVTVYSTMADREFSCILSGTSNDGMLKVYSSFRFNLTLQGVNLTNANGPAINIQSGKKCTLTLGDGTFNFLQDGSVYAGSTEDQKAVFFSEGQVEVQGSGNLTLKSVSNHALCSDDHIIINSGGITISGSGKDGIHVNSYFKMNGGTLNITSSGDGIECENGYIEVTGGDITTANAAVNVNGMDSFGNLTISGGTIRMTVSGNRSKGLRARQGMVLSGGDITINATGNAALVTSGAGSEPDYCTTIKGSGDILVSGSKITITHTGAGGKGISSDTNISVTSGNVSITASGAGASYKNSGGVTDSYKTVCLTSDGTISITGGSVNLTNSGTGGRGILANGNIKLGESDNSLAVNITVSGSYLPEGTNKIYPKAVKSDGTITVNKGRIITLSTTQGSEGIQAPFITVNNGYLHVTASDDGINSSNGWSNKEANDGSCIYFHGGEVYVDCKNNDGLDSNGNIVMTGGTVVVHGPQSSPEVGMDYNGTFNISGGLLAVSGTSSNMTEGPGTTSAQYSIIAKTTTGQSSIFHVEDASGNNLLTFKPLRNYYSMVFSSPDLKSGGNYKIFTGGTSTGTSTNGFYTGGTYSGGTLKKSFSISSKVTTVTF